MQGAAGGVGKHVAQWNQAKFMLTQAPAGKSHRLSLYGKCREKSRVHLKKCREIRIKRCFYSVLLNFYSGTIFNGALVRSAPACRLRRMPAL
ncbi:hypothetical protein GJ699_28860 [Duganella sp. FT80W]|uniref:Uncharacterized protein n=1 Tax=Duganella guangzhouensis TaxID=2666084 RepID=A0A6I2L790_9BURK|nr:hypothetical protein [Duganella guangzhouensis]